MPDLPSDVTQWVKEPPDGRDRGPRGLARAWVEVLLRPRRFFRTGVAPGDQAPGLVFAIAVAVTYAGTRFVLVPNARPEFFANEAASIGVGILVVALVLAPAALHLTAALQTLLLIVGAPERAGVSETVQIIAYASAPCALAGLAIPSGMAIPTTVEMIAAGWRLGCALWGAGLLVFGVHTIHGTSVLRALLLAVLPAVVVFGYLFGGLFAAETVFGIELVDTSPPSQ